MLRIHYNTVYTAPLKSFIRCIRFPFGNSFNGIKLGGAQYKQFMVYFSCIFISRLKSNLYELIYEQNR